MNNKKFNSKEELDNYLLSNKTPFSVIDQKIDYSLIKKNDKKIRFGLKTKILASLSCVLLVVTLCLGGYFIKNINNKSNCPFELGTYTYASQEGSIEGLDFSESSYIVLTDEKLTGPGTFVIEDEENDWVVYGEINNSSFDNLNFNDLEKGIESYEIDFDFGHVEFIFSNFGEISHIRLVILNENKETMKLEFKLNK